jgi:dihydrofolate reductase
MSPRISFIVALGHNRVIGKDNDLLWHLPDDLKRFKKLTLGHPVIMGRKTWQSLPDKVRPLPGRTNIVVTRFEDYPADGAQVAHSFPEALSLAKDADGADEIFVIGGGELYRAALPFASRLYLTIVDDPTPGTVFFPEYEQDFLSEVEREEHVDGNYRYTWLTLDR